jgi:hypothetical protein
MANKNRGKKGNEKRAFMGPIFLYFKFDSFVR